MEQNIAEMLDNKRQEVFDELQHIEERMKKNFEPKRNKKDEPEGIENSANAEESVMQTEEITGDQSVQENSATSTDVEQPKIEDAVQPAEEKPEQPEENAVEINTSNEVKDVEDNDEAEMPLVKSEISDSVQQSSTDTETNEVKDVDTQEQ